MWYLVTVLFFNALRLSAMDRYCPDMKPQSYVTIEQLLGMWYGVELINHKQNQEHLGIQYVDSCPIIHISEDHSPTVPPYYREGVRDPYGTNYGPTYQDGKYQQTNGYDNQGSYNQGSYGTNNDQYYRKTSHRGSTTYQGHKYGSEEYPIRYGDNIRRLRLLWTDNGSQMEYTLRYNASTPGFWNSPGLQNVSALEAQHNQFDGKIQVIKAVGNHLVLTFCHKLPDQQLYTVILSRKPRLTAHEISDVHDLLTRRALEINNIKQVCSQSGALIYRTNIFLLICFTGINLYAFLVL